jgi:hypothetical protein
MRPELVKRMAYISGVLVLWTSLLWGGSANAPSAQNWAPAAPGDSTVTLQVQDTTVFPGDSFFSVAVYLTSPDLPVAGIQFRLVASRPDLVRLPDSMTVFPPIDLTGSAIAGWDFAEGNVLAPTTFNFAALGNLPGGITPPPLSPSPTPRLICKFIVERVASAVVLDTLQDRAMTWFIDPVQTSFSNPTGTLIGRRDSLACINPPVCDSFVTVSYDANTYLNGTLTFGPSCGTNGDVNATGDITSSDIIYLVNFVFKAGPIPACNGASGDVECSGAITSSDIIYLVNYVFKGGSPPC